MINQFIEYIKKGRQQLKTLNQLSIKGSMNLKSFVFSILLATILIIPIIIIAYNVFSLYDPSTVNFKIMLVFCLLAIFLHNSISSSLYIILLKNYLSDLDELKSINTKDIFIVELFNPFMILLVVVVIVFLMVYKW